MRQVALLALAVLAACSDGGKPPPPPPPAPSGPVTFSLQPDAWAIEHSPNMPSRPAAAPDGWYFDFPVYDKSPTTQCAADPLCGSVHYVTASSGPLSSAQRLLAIFRLEEAGSPRYQALLAPDNICEPGQGQIRLFLQRAGDDLTLARGPNYRFWSFPLDLKGGETRWETALEAANWTNVQGLHDAAGLADALRNLGRAGVTFGGGCFAGHGVNISGGSSRFVLKQFGTVQ